MFKKSFMLTKIAKSNLPYFTYILHVYTTLCMLKYNCWHVQKIYKMFPFQKDIRNQKESVFIKL